MIQYLQIVSRFKLLWMKIKKSILGLEKALGTGIMRDYCMISWLSYGNIPIMFDEDFNEPLRWNRWYD